MQIRCISGLPLIFVSLLECLRFFSIIAWMVGLFLWNLPSIPANNLESNSLGDELNIKKEIPIGSKISTNITGKDIYFHERSLDESFFQEKKILVIVFVRTDCPLVPKYFPKLIQLDKEYNSKKVQFLAVNVNYDETIMEMATQAVQFNVPFPFLKDINGSLVKSLGVQRTPEVVVLDEERKIRYRGRIDDQYAPGKTLPKPRDDNLKNAIDAILANKPIAKTSMPSPGCRITLPSADTPAQPLTYYKDIAPLINNRCVSCHQKGGLAPFPLESYEQIKKQAEACAEVVHDGQMPPWYAAKDFGPFTNNSSLSLRERKKLRQWIDTGMKLGDPGDFKIDNNKVFSSKETDPTLAEPRTQTPTKANPNGIKADPNGISAATSGQNNKSNSRSEWQFGEPDLIISTNVSKLPAAGEIPYHYLILPKTFFSETWISSIEIKPENPAVVHHANLLYVSLREPSISEAMFVTGYVPGNTGAMYDPGVAYRIPPWSRLLLQVHYVATGKVEHSRIKVGIRFPKQQVKQQIHHILMDVEHFAIPAMHPHYSLRIGEKLPCDATVIALFCHMHKRGKAMIIRAKKPGQIEEPILIVPNYSFDWQMPYRYAYGKMNLPKGTYVSTESLYDNSPFNPVNPDPKAVVKSGYQTNNEMMQGFLFYVDQHENLHRKVNPTTGTVIP